VQLPLALWSLEPSCDAGEVVAAHDSGIGRGVGTCVPGVQGFAYFSMGVAGPVVWILVLALSWPSPLV
jgi:hypothetical protein